jgi:hypothetical protein
VKCGDKNAINTVHKLYRVIQSHAATSGSRQVRAALKFIIACIVLSIHNHKHDHDRLPILYIQMNVCS